MPFEEKNIHYQFFEFHIWVLCETYYDWLLLLGEEGGEKEVEKREGGGGEGEGGEEREGEEEGT